MFEHEQMMFRHLHIVEVCRIPKFLFPHLAILGRFWPLLAHWPILTISRFFFLIISNPNDASNHVACGSRRPRTGAAGAAGATTAAGGTAAGRRRTAAGWNDGPAGAHPIPAVAHPSSLGCCGWSPALNRGRLGSMWWVGSGKIILTIP